MIFDHRYPGTDLHELDLAYVLGEVNALKYTLNNFVKNNTFKFADPIEWDITTQYAAVTIVKYRSHIFYVSTQPVPAGIQITNTNYWYKLLDYSGGGGSGGVGPEVISIYDNGSSTTAIRNYTAWDILWYNDTLYTATENIAQGATLTVGTNINEVTVGELITRLINDSIQYDSDISGILHDLGVVQNDLSDAQGDISDIEGDITSLQAAYGYNKNAITTYDQGTSNVAIRNYNAWELFWMNNNLYLTLRAVTSGTTMVSGTDYSSITLSYELKRLVDDSVSYAAAISALQSAVSALQFNIVHKTSADTSQTLAANTFYVWPEMSTLTITCPATGGPYAFRFESGSTPTTFTMTGISMPTGFQVEANSIYEINVLEGYGVIQVWEA